MTSDYKIEYDKSLKPQAIREKSIERKVLANQMNVYKKKSSKEENVDFIRNEPKTKVSDNNIDSDNVMSDTEGGLSSYAPSERTKNFFVNQFKDNSNDKSSVLSNSLNYSEDQMNNHNYNEDYKSNNNRTVKFNNNYVNRTKN